MVDPYAVDGVVLQQVHVHAQGAFDLQDTRERKETHEYDSGATDQRAASARWIALSVKYPTYRA